MAKGFTFDGSIKCYRCGRKFSPTGSKDVLGHTGESPERCGWSSRRVCTHCGALNEMHDQMMRRVWSWGPPKE